MVTVVVAVHCDYLVLRIPRMTRVVQLATETFTSGVSCSGWTKASTSSLSIRSSSVTFTLNVTPTDFIHKNHKRQRHCVNSIHRERLCYTQDLVFFIFHSGIRTLKSYQSDVTLQTFFMMIVYIYFITPNDGTRHSKIYLYDDI